jgi:hypothetical protein
MKKLNGARRSLHKEKIHDLKSLTIRQTDRQTCFCASVDSTGSLLGYVTVLHETNV